MIAVLKELLGKEHKERNDFTQLLKVVPSYNHN